MAEVLMPVGPRDRIDWLKASIESLLRQSDFYSRFIIYDNSEREDIGKVIDSYTSNKLVHIKDKRMKRVNMAILRNRMLQYATERYLFMIDSDVVIPENGLQKMLHTLTQGVVMTWMHYAYSFEELQKPSGAEENPNLGCSAVDFEILKKIGLFDEKYERDEDVWLYAKLRKLGYRVMKTEGRCLHLNKVHARQDLRSSLEEAKRNFWRSKYDMMLLLDGLADPTFLTSYAYFWSYYVTGVIGGLVFKPFLFLYIPIIGFGLWYYKRPKRYILNLIPGLALAISSPYGLFYALRRR
ncbi:MAG: glycosyltransferase [Sulfolobaceae archaeon]|nr:glycosyltransferase [Sulfolobaceae archaeon]